MKNCVHKFKKNDWRVVLENHLQFLSDSSNESSIDFRMTPKFVRIYHKVYFFQHFSSGNDFTIAACVQKKFFKIIFIILFRSFSTNLIKRMACSSQKLYCILLIKVKESGCEIELIGDGKCDILFQHCVHRAKYTFFFVNPTWIDFYLLIF